MLSPAVFKKISQILGPLEVDLFPSQLTHQSVLQLETGPTGKSSRCFSIGLEPVEGVCQSSTVLNGTRVEQGEVTRGSTNLSGSSMERPVLVSCSSENADGFSASSHYSRGKC